MELEFNWFNEVLNPNRRTRKHPRKVGKRKAIHWSEKAKARAEQKEDAYYVALSYPKPEAREKYVLNITFHPKSNHKQDVDNALAACKGLLDGVALAWGVDDSQFVLVGAMTSKVDGGKIIIETEE